MQSIFRARSLYAVSLAIATFGGLTARDVQAQSVTYTTVYEFSGGPDGRLVYGGLVQAPNGNLYGTTHYGGSSNDGGTIFELTTDGQLTTLHSFQGGGDSDPVFVDGNHPFGTLIFASDGLLYGTTLRGGAGQCSDGGSEKGCGTVFSITTEGEFESIYAFEGTDDGGSPGGVVESNDGDLFGTTLSGPIASFPRAYRVTKAGDFTTLHTFPEIGGPDLRSKLVRAQDGNFYGTTYRNGEFDEGTVFRLTPSGQYDVIHDFESHNGANPIGALTEGLDGNLYGVTGFGGGTHDLGTVFRVSPTGDFVEIHEFAGDDEGAYPISGLVQASDGFLYGTTLAGGTGVSVECELGCGTIFRIASDGTLETLHSFAPSSGAPGPSELIEGQDGAFYGTTIGGGSDNSGTVFKLTLTAAPPPPPPPPPPDGGSGGGGRLGFYEIVALLLAWISLAPRSSRRTATSP